MEERAEVWGTRVSLVFTAIAVAGLGLRFGTHGVEVWFAADWAGAAQLTVFAVSVLFLLYGNFVYQWCRLAYYRRRAAHRPAPRDDIEEVFDGRAPALAILIPSYKEQPRVVLQTVLSAAFTEYPEKTIVLLLDDPPDPAAAADRIALDSTRRAVRSLQARLDAIAERYRASHAAFCARIDADLGFEHDRLAVLYEDAAATVQQLARDVLDPWEADTPAHSDAFFSTQVAGGLARHYLAFARQLRQRGRERPLPDRAFFDRHYRRLARSFDVRLSTFERKRFANLSHEANKAMNLNSYIGLMGRSWRQVPDGDRWLLREADAAVADLAIPAPDYLITLDADSLVMTDYALRLIHQMERPEHARVAVLQTPYSAIPGAPGTIERIAGATTDLQFIVHQGFTGGDATFWVGANALIRRRALEDIRHTRVERGHTVPVYIHDRTVIEDTESSVDLILAGWTLFNYPSRLAYSATPPDFGSLLIQRRRWANGGLLVLGKLLRYARRAPKTPRLARELALRFHYLASLAGVSAATLTLFFFPFDEALATAWLPLSALPYFVLYARDLRLAGYRRTDVARVYALNLVLIPVIVGGVLKSLQQGLAGTKIPFRRTPKVASRSAAPPLYCAIELALPIAFLLGFAVDFTAGRWSHAAFGLMNAALFAYGLVALLGVRETLSDLAAAWQRRPVPPAAAARGSTRAHASPETPSVIHGATAGPVGQPEPAAAVD